MRKKLFLSYLLVLLIAVGISTFAFWSNGYDYLGEKSKDYYLMQARMLADSFQKEELSDNKAYDNFVKVYAQKYNVRITLIERSGAVVADSSLLNDTLDNHKTREEVSHALNGEAISVSRYSKSMGEKYSYSAIPLYSDSFDGVLRISVPLSSLNELDHKLVNIVWLILVLSIVVAVILATVFTNIISKPIEEIADGAEKVSEGNYSIKIYTREKGQIGRLATAYNTMTTNLKSNVNKLKQRNAELEAMLGSMHSGVVAIDNTDAILFYNKSFCDLIECGTKDITNKSLYNIVRNTAIFDAIDEVRKTKDKVKNQGYLNLSDSKMIDISAAPLTLRKEKVLGVLLIIEDISQMKKLESIRSDFVSNVTHELKTPLTSIQGFIETLKNGAIKDEVAARKFLDIIDIEAERLYTLIQDILILSEIESKRDYELISCDIGDTVKEVVELLRANRKKNVELLYTINDPIRPFYCNPDRMKQLLINLLDNALKYTEEGFVSITCEEVNNKLVLHIRDTGIGIAKEHQERIFERFYRVDRGRSRKQGGTGLGLSIVKHIVELYHGRIELISDLGHGTEFIIKLPYPEREKF